jgi:hypothetical protein
MFLGSASEVRAASINCDRAFITFRYNFNKRPQFNYALKIGLSVA